VPRNETAEHTTLKTLIADLLRDEFNATAVNEYPATGNELDVFSVNNGGISIMAEVIWTKTKQNFLHDLLILTNSDANIKIVICNPEIIKSESLRRLFDKTKVTQLKNGFQISSMIDGNKLLNDDTYRSKVIDEIKRLIQNKLKQTTNLDPQINENTTLIKDILDNEEISPILTKVDLEYVKELIEEYLEFKDKNDRVRYLQKFAELSHLSDLYKHQIFTNFLINEIKIANDEDILIQSLYVLIQLLSTSKASKDQSFINIAFEELYDTLVNYVTSLKKIHEYSYFELLSILNYFDKMYDKKKLCDVFWMKLRTLVNLSSNDIVDQRIVYCITFLKKAEYKLNKSQREWLNQEDQKKKIKKYALGELL
jgi:hypothetical protein